MADLVTGFAFIFQLEIFVVLFLGVCLGLVFGLIPGLSGLTALAILIPFVYGMEPALGLAFLMSVHSVVYTGGSVTAILLNIPGAPPNAATLIDGYPMSQKGEARRAIAAGLTSSGLGGLVGGIVILASLPLLKAIVFAFGSGETFLLTVTGICFIAGLTRGSVVKGLMSASLGLAAAFIGFHPITGMSRFTFGTLYLYDGISLIPKALGLFAIPEIINLLGKGKSISAVKAEQTSQLNRLTVGIKDVFKRWWLFIRCSVIGAIVGIIPGAGGGVAAFLAYGHAQQSSKHPEEFGKGTVEGVIAPESANNAKEGGALMPTLSLAIPGSPGMALLLGAFLVLGLQPGPTFLQEHMPIAYTIVGTLIMANLVGAGVCLALSGQLAKITYLRGTLLAPILMPIIMIGAYAMHHDILDVIALIVWGAIGYGMARFGYNRPAMVLAFVLGGIMEKYFYLSIDAYGAPFLLRPICIGLIVAIFATFALGPIKVLIRRLRS